MTSAMMIHIRFHHTNFSCLTNCSVDEINVSLLFRYFDILDITLDHKTSLKSLGYICSKSQKYIVWVKMINFLNI